MKPPPPPVIMLCRRKAPPMEFVLTVASRHGCSREDILGRGRTQDLSFVRQLIMYLSVKAMGCSLEATGRAIKRDHGTVAAGLKRFQGFIDTDLALAESVKKWMGWAKEFEP